MGNGDNFGLVLQTPPHFVLTTSETVEKGEFTNRGLPYNLHFLVCLIE
jgi:hypothetical protein